MPNRLAKETSPYLLQHAQNPVDWYPWGDEALQRARTEDRPVLLSIGYSACHWCHVMEHECFENDAIARLMNENFINIKVDREERPDLDHIYMEAVQAMTNSGGWPLTVFLTPEGKPFFGGTYFPPEDRPNMPGFPKILKAVKEAYNTRRSSIEQTTSQIEEMLNTLARASQESGLLSEQVLKQAFMALEQCFDLENGGFGGAPKFPHPMTLEFLLRYYLRYEEKKALEMVKLTLEKMAGGGIYDQIGGGFHRYATDKNWLFPHFEKMLYDNALLSRVYLQAFLVTREKPLLCVAEDTLDYVLREMRSPLGGFYSTQDADSEDEEGKYYLWTAQEIEELLGDNVSGKVNQYYGISVEGNFDGRNVLHRTDHQEYTDIITEVKRSLLRKREERVKPGRDEKILASWNGMMLTSLAEAAGITQREDYKSSATANGAFILDHMMVEGKLKHTFKDGKARIEGFLEDYAQVIEGLMALHRTTLEGKWMTAALDLARTMVEQFRDKATGLLYDTQSGQKDLFVRPRNNNDGAVPAGTSAAVLVLLKMSDLTGINQYQEVAIKELGAVKSVMGRVPLGYSQWLCDLDYYLSAKEEIVIVGHRTDPQTQDVVRTLYNRWLPNTVLAAVDPGDPSPLKGLPLLENRAMKNGQTTVYICRNNTCKEPVNGVSKLEEQLSTFNNSF